MKPGSIASVWMAIFAAAMCMLAGRSASGAVGELVSWPNGGLPFDVVFCKDIRFCTFLNQVVVHVRGEKARVGDHEVALTDLATFLRAYTRQAGTKYLVIAQQPEAPIKDTLRLLDACKGLDIKCVIVAIDDVVNDPPKVEPGR